MNIEGMKHRFVMKIKKMFLTKQVMALILSAIVSKNREGLRLNYFSGGFVV
jgi:hypothetical protein